jgi:uncharacterized protein YhaN
MPLDLLSLESEEAERLACSEGFTQTAILFGRLADAERERDALAEEVEDLRNQICALESRIADLEEERGT